MTGASRLDDVQSHPSGEPRGQTKLNITEDVRKYAAEQRIAESEALARGMAAKSEEFAAVGANLYWDA